MSDSEMEIMNPSNVIIAALFIDVSSFLQLFFNATTSQKNKQGRNLKSQFIKRAGKNVGFFDVEQDCQWMNFPRDVIQMN